MNYMQIGLSLLLAAFSTAVSAQVEFRLAYMEEKPNTIAATFPNDQLFRFMAATPYVHSSELKSASVLLQDGRAVVHIRIADSARRNINRLVASNLKSQATRSLDGHVGLAVLLNGRVYSVVQGMIHKLPSAQMQLDTGDSQLSQNGQLQEAQALAAGINR